jgi:hypothetical protein
LILVENIENEFVAYNLLHYKPYKSGARNSAFFC